MSLTIKSFGDRHSFELIRDEVVIGGLAYASDMRSLLLTVKAREN